MPRTPADYGPLLNGNPGNRRKYDTDTLRFKGQNSEDQTGHDTANHKPRTFTEDQRNEFRHGSHIRTTRPKGRSGNGNNQQHGMCDAEPDGAGPQEPSHFEHAENMGGTKHRERQCHSNDSDRQVTVREQKSALFLLMLLSASKK